MDTVHHEPAHARRQLENHLNNMTDDGYLPGVVKIDEPPQDFTQGIRCTHPPVWPVAVDALMKTQYDETFLTYCLDCVQRQISWYETHRKVPDGGYFYTDISEEPSESAWMPAFVL